MTRADTDPEGQTASCAQTLALNLWAAYAALTLLRHSMACSAAHSLGDAGKNPCDCLFVKRKQYVSLESHLLTSVGVVLDKALNKCRFHPCISLY